MKSATFLRKPDVSLRIRLPKAPRVRLSRRLSLRPMNASKGVISRIWNPFMTRNEVETVPKFGTAPTLQLSTPVASEVVESQAPTAVWYIEVSFVLLKIKANAMTYGVEFPTPIETEITKCQDLNVHHRRHIHRRRQEEPSETIGAFLLEEVEELEKHEKTMSYEKLYKEAKELFEHLFEQKRETRPKEEAYESAALQSTAEGTSIQDYKDLFKTIPLPEIANTYQEDETFAKMRVAGPNPMIIEGVTKQELKELIGDRLTDDDFNAILGTSGDSIEKAGDEGRLCVTNYKVLSPTKEDINLGRSFVTDPIAIFAEPISGCDTIKPVAIQLGQNHDNELILANTSDSYRWLIAKTVVNVADANHHELVSHLGHTHLVVEVFSIATQQHLPVTHPLHRLLMPHLEGTNFINHIAALQLLVSDGSVDHIFAHTEDRLRSLQGLSVRERSVFDFENRIPDVELNHRHVDQLKVFPYRDDARLIWDAIHSWVTDYVDLYYSSDSAVDNDNDVRAWGETLVNSGDVMKFKAPQTKGDLSRVLAMIIFTASAQHSAVNFPQQQMMTFAPAFSGVAWDNLPENDPAKEEQYLRMLPPLIVAKEQLEILHLLGGVYYRRLGEYASNVFPYHGTLEPSAGPALESFRNSLKEIEKTIEERNKSRGAFAYDFLLPSKIAASTNI